MGKGPTTGTFIGLSELGQFWAAVLKPCWNAVGGWGSQIQFYDLRSHSGDSDQHIILTLSVFVCHLR